MGRVIFLAIVLFVSALTSWLLGYERGRQAGIEIGRTEPRIVAITGDTGSRALISWCASPRCYLNIPPDPSAD